MEQLKQILQLKADGIPIREMARRVGISRNSVRKYLAKLNTVAESMTSIDMASAVYSINQIEGGARKLEQLIQYFGVVEKELKRTGVTAKLIWHEYLQQAPQGYGYSQFCFHLNRFLKNRDVSLHLEYRPGDLIMIDFAGKKLRYVDSETGECIDCHVFVAILPFSGLIFCQAVHSQGSEDFVICINAMVRYFGGVTLTILCDNFKTAVIRPSRYEPVFTDLCYQLSDHYKTTFSATRPYSPRDKAMVERAVRIVYEQVYAPIRNQVFNSLQALNVAIRDHLMLLNHKSYKNTAFSRWYYYENQEKSMLRELPSEPFCPKKVVHLTVQRNYHIQLSENHHYYSVPYQFVGKKVKVLYDASIIEIYFDYNRIAIHSRQPYQKSYTTIKEHMPPHHQKMQQIKGWNKEDLLDEAGRIGLSTHQAATLLLDNSIYIEQNYKSCFGMLKLRGKYGTERLEAACERALLGHRPNYTMIKNILERGLDQQTLDPKQEFTIPFHENIRGKENYQ